MRIMYTAGFYPDVKTGMERLSQTTEKNMRQIKRKPIKRITFYVFYCQTKIVPRKKKAKMGLSKSTT